MIIDPKYGAQFDATDGTIGGLRLVKRWRAIRADGESVHARQGRFTYPTEDACRRVCDDLLAANPETSNNHVFVDGANPVEFWCYPHHFDPVGLVVE